MQLSKLHTVYLGFFLMESLFSQFSGFLLSMGFSPGLCRAGTTDLNQLLYSYMFVSLAHVVQLVFF